MNEEVQIPGLLDGEPLATGLRRIATAEVEAAAASLRGDDVHEGVHDARKRLKRVRAVLRMVRDDLGPERYGAENVFFRDCGRELAEVRDAKVRLQTLDGLLAHTAESLDADEFAELRRGLIDRFEGIAHRHLDVERRHLRVAAALEGSAAQIELWPVGEDRFETIGPGVRRVYRRGLKRGRKAFDDPSFERFHEWRKRVKYLATQLLVLEATVPRLMHGLNDSLGKISDLIGDSTDLAELSMLLRSDLDLVDASHRTMLVELIDARRAELRALSRPLARQVWRYAPDDFVERLAAYWDAWRRDHPVRARPAAASTENAAGSPALEIERKFLVLGEPRGRSVEIRQGYLSIEDPEIRVRLADGAATLTVKSDRTADHAPGRPLERSEVEIPLAIDQARELLELCPWELRKTRYFNGRWEIDEFRDPRRRLIAEVELSSADEPLPDPPAWLRVVREVTDDPAYRNRNLARRNGKRGNSGPSEPEETHAAERPHASEGPLDVLERVLRDVERLVFGD